MLLFCNKVHITTVRVHQIAPLTHKCSHTNTGYPNDRVTGWLCTVDIITGRSARIDTAGHEVQLVAGSNQLVAAAKSVSLLEHSMEQGGVSSYKGGTQLCQDYTR